MKNNLTDTEIEQFNNLKKEWIDATAYHSSSTIIYSHKAIYAIIEMGEKILPLIFEDMAKELNWEKREGFAHWFQAIRRITGKNIDIPEEIRGKIMDLNQFYIQWGKDNGYI